MTMLTDLNNLERTQRAAWSLACAFRLEPFVRAARLADATRLFEIGADVGLRSIGAASSREVQMFSDRLKRWIEANADGDDLESAVQDSLVVLAYALDSTLPDGESIMEGSVPSVSRVATDAAELWDSFDYVASASADNRDATTGSLERFRDGEAAAQTASLGFVGSTTSDVDLSNWLQQSREQSAIHENEMRELLNRYS